MRKLLLLFLPCIAFAGGPKYGHEPAKLNDEMENVYHDIRIAQTTASSVAITVASLQSGGATSFVSLTGDQSVTGIKNFAGQLMGKGTATNDSPATGYIGEYVSANVNANTAFTTSGAYADLTSISLTAGNWLVTSVVRANSLTSTTMTGFEIGISLVTGNSTSGLTATENYVPLTFPTTGHGVNEAFMSIAVPPVVLLSSSTRTVYLKYSATYTGTAPAANGSIRAVRIR